MRLKLGLIFSILSKVDKLDGGGGMRYISASDAKQRLGAVLDAAQREPVTIRRQNREVAVVLSAADYERITAANVSEFQRFCDRVSTAAADRGLTETRLEELLED